MTTFAQLVGLERVPSPFARAVATGYYDGLTEGIVECRDGSFVVVRLLDWDDRQDVRVFAVFDVGPDWADSARALFEDVCGDYPVTLASEHLSGVTDQACSKLMALGEAQSDYVVVAKDLGRQLLRVVAFPGGDTARDWLSEFEFDRG